MNTSKRIIFAGLILAGVLSAPLVFTGCKTTDAQVIAFKTLKTTQIAVDRAMNVYAEAVVTGKVSVPDVARIDAAHARYRAGFRFAIAATRNDLSAVTPDDVARLSGELLTLIKNLNL